MVISRNPVTLYVCANLENLTMFKKIPGCHTYSATLGGQIRNDETGCVPVIINNEMPITIYGKTYTLPVGWLGLVAHYEINLPENLQEFLTDIKFVEHCQSVTRSKAFHVPVFPDSLKDGEYRIIPQFSNYSVTQDGTIVEINSGKVVKVYEVDDDLHYPTVYIYNPDRSLRTAVKVHRLVALAWVDNCNWATNSVVNHLDNDKTNYHYTNLEWTTYGKNNMHAADNGFISSTVECKLLDTITDQVYLFNSIAQAYRYFDIRYTPRQAVFLSCSKGTLIEGRYEAKRLDDATEWYSRKYKLTRKVQHVITVKNGHTVEQYDIASFKKQFTVWNVSNVEAMLRKARVKYPEYTFEITTLRPLSVGIQALDLITNAIIDEPSMRAFERRTGIAKSLLQTIVRTGQQRRVGDLLIRKQSCDEWVKEYFIPPSTPKRILATNTANHEHITFDSLRHAAAYFTIDKKTVKDIVEHRREIDGWLLSY